MNYLHVQYFALFNYTILPIDQSFNMRLNDSFQIANTETVYVTHLLIQLEVETEQNFIEDNDRMDESDLEVCEEEAERLLNVELRAKLFNFMFRFNKYIP